MKHIKRRLVTSTFYDRTSIQKYLETQAAQGWMLEKIDSFGWIFRRIEPAKVHFAVTYFPSATAFDPAPSEGQQRFQDFCAHTGWEHIASNAQLQVFLNRADDPIPIETDPEIELDNIHASVKKSFLPTYVANTIVALMQIGLFAQRLSWDPVGELANLSSLISLLFWLLYLSTAAVQIFLYYRWLRQARIAAREGNFLETKSTDRLQYVMLLFSTLALVSMVVSYGDPSMFWTVTVCLMGVIGIIALVTTLSNRMKKQGVSASSNRNRTFGLTLVLSLVLCGGLVWLVTSRIAVPDDRRKDAEVCEYNGWTYYVYHDELPVTIEDLMDTDYTGFSRQEISNEGSPLLSRYTARQEPGMDALEQPEIWYQVVTVHVPALYDWCLDQMLAEFSHNYAFPEDDDGWSAHTSIDPEPWGAVAAYQLTLGGEPRDRYILCYASRIIEIDLDWTPDQGQMAIIGDKLNP